MKKLEENITELDILKNKVQQKKLHLEELIKKTYSKRPIVLVEYDLKALSYIAEMVEMESHYLIRLNPTLLLELKENYINEVFVHEYAHCVVYERFPSGFNYLTQKKVKPHGVEFKEVCKLFGIEGSATSNIAEKTFFMKNKTEKVKNNRKFFEYTCDCGKNHKISLIRHNKIIKGIKKYICSDCRSLIKEKI